MFDEMGIFPVHGEDEANESGNKISDSVQTLDQRLVGTIRLDNFKERSFCLNVLLLLEKSERDGIDERD